MRLNSVVVILRPCPCSRLLSQGNWRGSVRINEHNGARQISLALLVGLAELCYPVDGLRSRYLGRRGVGVEVFVWLRRQVGIAGNISTSSGTC